MLAIAADIYTIGRSKCNSSAAMEEAARCRSLTIVVTFSIQGYFYYFLQLNIVVHVERNVDLQDRALHSQAELAIVREQFVDMGISEFSPRDALNYLAQFETDEGYKMKPGDISADAIRHIFLDLGTHPPSSATLYRVY